MKSCRGLELALYDRAAKTLAPEDAARVDAHLARCAACRAEAERIDEAVELAKVPPLAPTLSGGREQDLALSTLSRWKSGQRRRVVALALGAGLLAAAGAASVIAPALGSHSRRAVSGPAVRGRGDLGAAAGTSHAAWDASALLDPEAETETETTAAEEIAQAALDAAGSEAVTSNEEEDI